MPTQYSRTVIIAIFAIAAIVFIFSPQITHAQCTPAADSSDNTINCDAPATIEDVDGQGGNGIIYLNPGAVVGDGVDADNTAVDGGTGNDSIVNDASVAGDIQGNSGNDTVINNTVVTGYVLGEEGVVSLLDNDSFDVTVTHSPITLIYGYAL